MSTHPNQFPVPTGFVLGVLGGVAVSMGLVGLVVGMNFGGVSAPGYAVAPTQVAAGDAPVVMPEPPPPADAPKVDPKTDHIRGNPNAQVTIIEYSDYECPFCKRHHPTMKQVLEKYGDKVNWVYRHFPLSFHPSAQKAAEASECAAELGGNEMFWKYSDALMGLTQISVDQLVPTAKTVGLDEAKFKSCLDSGKWADKVAQQMKGGTAAGVNGTPGNIVVSKDGDSQLVSGAVPLASFTSVIDGMLN